MSLDPHEQRQFVADLYPGPKWKARVKLMPPQQIYMIYHSRHALDEGEAEEHHILNEQLQLNFEETR